MKRAASMVWMVWMAWLVGCGGAALAPGTTVRHELACTETGPTGETACVARGCRWGAPSWCSGVAPDPGDEDFAHDVTRECVCTCEADDLECATRP